MPGDIQPYLNLVTLEHDSKPHYMAMIAATVQPFADTKQVTAGFISDYSIETAVGQQLDRVGQIVGIARPPEFDDDLYRIVLQVRILNNHWLCNKPSAYYLMNQIFGALGFQFLLDDHADLSITEILLGGVPSPGVIALLVGGYLDIKPVTIRLRGYAYPSSDGPIFAFDRDDTVYAGLDTGIWLTFVSA